MRNVSLLIVIIIVIIIRNKNAFAVSDLPAINEGYGDFLLVPAGEFKMGDNHNENNKRARPVHSVYIDSFYVGKYEVSNAEYKKFIDDSAYSDSSYWDVQRFKTFGSTPFYWNDTLDHLRNSN